jgi:hemerythrin-like domain-containing protein
MTGAAARQEDRGDFSALLEVHRALDALFAEHQEALLDRDIIIAARKLAAFDAGIREHIALEEDRLFPIYRRAGHIPGGAVELYRAEHRKILEYLDRIRSMVEALKPGTPEKQALIRLLDEETSFKRLMEHHDLREQNILYPALNRVATPGEKLAVLSRLS